MWSNAHISKVQPAVHACNHYEIKKEILCVLGSDYESDRYRRSINPWKFWKSVEEKAIAVLPDRRTEKPTPGRICLLPAIGMRMLNWAEYHEGILNLPHGYCAKFLNASLFTECGIIDNKATAQALIADVNLSVKQKYTLACLHCFFDRIRDLYCRMSNKDKKLFYDAENPSRIMQPGLVKFWTYYFMDDVDKIRGDKAVDEYKLDVIVESGNRSAIEYWLEKTGSRRDDIIEAALKTVGRKLRAEWATFRDSRIDIWNWIVFRRRREYNGIEKFYAPGDHYVDILAFLLFKMKRDQRVKFLRADIEGAQYERTQFDSIKHSNVLDFFLHWPYQDLFMEAARLMWDFLPEDTYAVLLLKIADKIEPEVGDYLKHGEERTYDYRRLLMQFWEESPKKLKRYVFSNYYMAYDRYSGVVGTCTGLLKKFLNLSDVHLEHIKIILTNATNEEKEHIFSSAEWIEICVFLMKCNWKVLDEFVINDLLKDTENWKVFFLDSPLAHSACVELMESGEWEAANSFIKWSSSPEKEAELRERIIATEAWKSACCRLMDEEKWDKLDEFVRNHLHSEEKIKKFKREFICWDYFQYFCLSKFIQNGRWNAAESFLKWSTLAEDKVNEVKSGMIWSWRGRMTCCCLIRFRKLDDFEKFITWHDPSEEEAKKLRRNLIHSCEAMRHFKECAEADELELANEFINSCLSTEEEIKELKRRVAYENGCEVLKHVLICGKTYFFDTESVRCNWELAEKFLNWCFPSEVEVKDYKRNVLVDKSGMEIHFGLLSSNQRKAAKEFLAWLDLPPEEISKLKKNTLFHFLEAGYIFSVLFSSHVGDERFAAFGSKAEAIEKLLRLYLTDREAVELFKLIFGPFINKLTPEKQRLVRSILDPITAKLLEDFN